MSGGGPLPPVASAASAAAPPAPPRPRPARRVAAVLAAWTVVVAALAGLAPPWALGLLAGAAAVVTAASTGLGDGVADRVAGTAAALAGLVCLAGWAAPLAPRLVAGLVVVAIGAPGLTTLACGTARWPRLGAGDVAVGLVALAGAGLAAWPLRGGHLGQLAALFRGFDAASHADLVAGVVAHHGYLAVGAGVDSPLRTYPQGSHLLAAGLLALAGVRPTGIAVLSAYVAAGVVALAVTAGAAAWCVERAGRALPARWSLPPALAMGGLVVLGPPADLLAQGFYSLLVGAGLLLLAAGAAVGADRRPVAASVAAAGGLVAAVHAYPLLLAPAPAVWGAAAWASRDWWRGHRVAAAAATVAVGLACLPPLAQAALAGDSKVLLADGGVHRLNVGVLVALTALAALAVGLLVGDDRRRSAAARQGAREEPEDAAVRALAGVAAMTVAGCLALGAVQLAAGGHTAYYWQKSLVVWLVMVTAAGLSACAALGARTRRPGSAAAAGCAVVVLAVLAAVLAEPRPSRTTWVLWLPGVDYAGQPQPAAVVTAEPSQALAAAQVATAPGQLRLVWNPHNRLVTQWASVLTGSWTTAESSLADSVAHRYPDSAALGGLAGWLASHPGDRVLVIPTTPAQQAELAAFAATHPQVQVAAVPAGIVAAPAS